MSKGRKCTECSDGWEHFNGMKFKRLGRLREVLLLAEPSDRLSKPAYDFIKKLRPEPGGAKTPAKTRPPRLAGKAKKIDKTPVTLSVCMTGRPATEIIDALARTKLFATPPTTFEGENGKPVKAPTAWAKKLAAEKDETTASWARQIGRAHV